MFILPCHDILLFWQWGFREDLMFFVIVHQVIAFCGRRKLKLWPRSCWRCRRTSGSSRQIRRWRPWLPKPSKHSSSLKNTILFVQLILQRLWIAEEVLGEAWVGGGFGEPRILVHKEMEADEVAQAMMTVFH